MDRRKWTAVVATAMILVAAIGVMLIVKYPRAIVVQGFDPSSSAATASVADLTTSTAIAVPIPPLDIAAYNAKLLQLANLRIIRHVTVIRATTSTPTSTIVTTSTIPVGWPVKTVYPEAGALLPFHRIVAYYGNLYSKQMGVLGEYPEPQMLQMLASTTAAWQQADPSTPVIPALDYIAVAAQDNPGPNGNYNLRMPASQIDQIIQMAQQINGIVILDVQVGQSNVRTEVPLLAPYLKLPQVNLALDPEFDMHNGARPGTVIGSMSAADIDFAADYLANLVNEYHLPPKILIVHRFTQAMVTNWQNITPLPQVEIVMDMDGFGPPAQKIKTYEDFIESDPVQFTGFKLFYKNDARAGHLMTPAEVLRLSPQPSFIQYQ
jgi:hypothetical protein